MEKGFDRQLLSGDEAIALAALHAGVALGTGYPGTPSTEILETFSELGGKAQWAPNEKVALEVGLGAAFGGGRTLVTMKHVGVNVAADPLFTAAYTGVTGALVLVSADDPGLASSQNEQDNRHYAVAAVVPMLEPSDSQEAYDFLLAAIDISESWHTPVLLRVTTRVCHSKTIVTPVPPTEGPPRPHFHRDIQSRVMIPAYARHAHRRLRERLAQLAAWNESSGLNRIDEPIAADADLASAGGRKIAQSLGIITSGISYMHAREAAPEARILKLGMTYPLAMKKIREFVASVDRCVIVEEGEPYLAHAVRAHLATAATAQDAGDAAGSAHGKRRSAAPCLNVEDKDAMYGFGELSVQRVRRILASDTSPEPQPPKGKPPQLCVGCPHRLVFETLHKLECIVAGDIGCYTLGVLPPFEAMDTCVCMGASIGVGLGLRHVLGPEQACKVVSVIGDSTFVHSGITGLVEMVYNPPPSGHVVLILDNGTTAMTGLQEHPGTGRTLDHKPTGRVVFEELARGLGLSRVFVEDPTKDHAAFEKLLQESLQRPELTLIIVRKPCLLAAKRIREFECQSSKLATETQRPQS